MQQDNQDTSHDAKQAEASPQTSEAVAKNNNNEKSVTIAAQPSGISSNQSSDGNNEPDSNLISKEACDDKPSANFGMAILVTLICPGAFFCGIAALLFGFKVKSQLNQGDINGAKQSSKFGRFLINGGYLTTCAILIAILIASITYELYRLFSGVS